MSDATPEQIAMADRICREHQPRLAHEAALLAIVEVMKAEEIEKAKLRRRVTDGAYMLEAYRQMLGEKGREVAKMWADKGLVRQHSSWTVDPYSLAGEEIARIHLEWEAAPKTRVDNLDAGI